MCALLHAKRYIWRAKVHTSNMLRLRCFAEDLQIGHLFGSITSVVPLWVNTPQVACCMNGHGALQASRELLDELCGDNHLLFTRTL